MYLYITINEENILQSWSKTRNMESEIEIEVVDDHPVLSTPFRYFKYIDGAVVKIDELELIKVKATKDIELNKACKESILAGFLHSIDGVDYWFSYDSEAQSNFLGSRPLLNEGVVPAIDWTVRIGGKDGEYSRIPITKEIMAGLTITILQHKDSNVKHYRDVLLPQVNAATTIEEVQGVVW